MEFWLFGWAPKSYRRKFPMKPLSMISLVPTILNALEEFSDQLSTDLKIIINTMQEKILIKDNIKKDKFIYNFNYSYQDLLELALTFKINYPYFRHALLIKNAIIYAIQQRKFYKQQCKAK